MLLPRKGIELDLWILIAEDDVDAATLYKAVLESRGHKVTTAPDGRKCLSIYRAAMRELESNGKASKSSPYDVVILDHMMPFASGLEVAKEITRINPRQRIIIASAFIRESIADSVRELKQVIEMIQKPFEPEVLAEFVEDSSTATKLQELNASAKDKPADIDELLERLRKIQKTGTI